MILDDCIFLKKTNPCEGRYPPLEGTKINPILKFFHLCGLSFFVNVTFPD